MRGLLSTILVLALAAPAMAQANIKGKVTGRLGEAVEQHNAEIEKQLNPNAAASAEKTSGWIEKSLANGTKVRLYFAHPPLAQKPNAKLPGLIVIQEWWGLNDDIQQRTREFADKGYYAVAVDLYDGKVTKDPKEAAGLKKGITDEGSLLRLKTGVGLLESEANTGAVDLGRVGVIGWCMGGSQAMNLAVNDPRVKACALFYGTPITDVAKLKALKGPVLGIFGKEDKSIPQETVDKFEQALTEAKVPHEIHRYDGVGHAFASRGNQATYNEAKAAEAWKVTWDWLSKNVAKTSP